MPGLPEVEIKRQYLHITSLRKEIKQVIVAEPRILKDTNPLALTATLLGHEFADTGRHGKYLFGVLENGASLIFHFGMTGGFTISEEDISQPLYTRFALVFSDTSYLAYHDPRKLGRISYTIDWHKWIRIKKLGPDALFTRLKKLRERLSSHKGMTKLLLLNQGVIAGIGNLYADEILFNAGIHPMRVVASLTSQDFKRIYTSLRTILRIAIRCKADEPCYPHTFRINQRFQGGACPICGTTLQPLSMNGRIAYFCPRDQPYGA